jgi:hypothetical protein
MTAQPKRIALDGSWDEIFGSWDEIFDIFAEARHFHDPERLREALSYEIELPGGTWKPLGDITYDDLGEIHLYLAAAIGRRAPA